MNINTTKLTTLNSLLFSTLGTCSVYIKRPMLIPVSPVTVQLERSCVQIPLSHEGMILVECILGGAESAESLLNNPMKIVIINVSIEP